MDAKKISKKVCLLGDPSVGKSSLIQKYVYDIFGEEYRSTVGAKITKKSNLLVFPKADLQVNLNLLVWDIAGQTIFQEVQKTYYKGAEGALVVADLTRGDTLESIENWITELFNVVGRKVPILVLGNKSDLGDEMPLCLDEVRNEADRLGYRFFSTSAKTGENVEEAFGSISRVLALEALKQDGEYEDLE